MAEQSTTRRRVDVVVTNPQGQVLAGQDSHNKTPGRLEIPGGGIEEGESVEQAARREVAEETGYKAKNVKTLKQRPFTDKKPGQDEKTYWRQAQVRPGAQVAPELGADDDALLNPQFMVPADLAMALQRASQMQANPERSRDAQKAQVVQKVGHMTPFEAGYAYTMKLAGVKTAATATELMLAPLLLGIGGAGAGGASGAMYGAATGQGAREMGQHGMQAGLLGGTALGAGLSGTALLAALARRGR